MTASTRERETEFEPVYHRYGPHRAGVPPLVPYFRELWHRRGFATEMSKASMRGANTSTFFGQAWLVLNPLLLAAVYYLLVTILRGKHEPAVFVHLTLSLFAFNLVSTSMGTGTRSVVSAGKLLINTAFPRLLIPLSAVRTALFRFLPTLPVYLLFHLIFLTRVWSPTMFLSLYFFGCLLLFSAGLAAFFATLQVYFRDTSSFLPFFVRIWMYLSPVLWLPENVAHFSKTLLTIIRLNPMYAMLGGYAESIQEQKVPDVGLFVSSGLWAVAAAVIGFLFFISRERDFAVRLT
ncbi:ABC transporter permease [Microlunatus spumicola]|uniref:ABC transporter permease n=1 Tax=Microlunatus spumicola TaxID=81499 RepID=A0ABP6XET0_9ACTN